MIKFIRTNQNTWDTVDKTQYLDSIVFIEDTQQVCVNNVNYFGKKLAGIERVEFSTSSISIEPNKFYFCNEILNELDITLLGEGIRNYFVEFLCDNTCVILPSNIKWNNNIVPDFTKTAIMTIKIQDDTAYLIDCRPFIGSCVIFTAEEANSTIGLEKLSTNQTLEYSRDGSNWSNMNTSTNISLNNGDKVYVRGILSVDNKYDEDYGIYDYTQFKMSGKIAASGNCNALWNYKDLNAPLKKYCGCYMFYNCTSLTTSPELPATTLAEDCYLGIFYNCTSLTAAPELPATELATECYAYMFYECSSLTTSPELPATTLAKDCYLGMFYNCTSLTTAPELPATTLAEYCYCEMFWGCTSLIAAPELPATELVNCCYNCMFYDCTSLTVAPELPATTLADYCYNCMFQNCTSLTTVPELPATTLAKGCYRYIFAGCTSLVTAPELPATTLAWICYLGMFQGCTSLTTAPELPATTLAPYCYEDMFQNCTSLTTAPELLATELAILCYSNMFYNCTNLNHITCLATNLPSTSCTSNWVGGVSSSGTFFQHPAMNDWTRGVNGIPEGWTIENVTTSINPH